MDEAASRIRDRQSATIERKRPPVEAALFVEGSKQAGPLTQIAA
jgi:hypothetical protein